MEGWVGGWMDGWMEAKAGLSMLTAITKPKMVRFLKIKFLIIIKLNFNGGQFYKKQDRYGPVSRLL